MHLLAGLFLGEMLLGGKLLSKGRASGSPFELVHVLPGRIRVRVHALQDNEELEQQIRAGLGTIDGVNSARMDLRTGSVLVLFEETPEVRKALVTLLEQISTPKGIGSSLPGVPFLRQRIQALGGEANARVMEQSKGATDLITMLGLAAALYGGKTVVAPGAISRWQGMTLLYWGYNILSR